MKRGFKVFDVLPTNNDEVLVFKSKIAHEVISPLFNTGFVWKHDEVFYKSILIYEKYSTTLTNKKYTPERQFSERVPAIVADQLKKLFK
ncbi:MAG: hypothetical protein Q8K51_08025 [Nitrospirota bacterium]|nr:hypothetical protein [Nitrospirota bacterium]